MLSSGGLARDVVDARDAGHPAGQAGRTIFARERELAALDDAIGTAATGSGGVCVIEGPGGIGKSRLLDEAKTRAGTFGLLVVSARGSELEHEFAFGVVRQLFERTVSQPKLGDRCLTGVAREAASVFGPPPSAGERDDVSFGILHGLYWLVVNLSALGPLLITIDDLQWCDRSSLRFLAYLAPRLAGLPVLVVGCVRSSGPGTDPELLRALVQDPATISLRPGTLAEEPTRELIAQRLGREPEAPFVSACKLATGGNPLLLHELLRAMEAEGVNPDAEHLGAIRDIGPQAVSHTVLTRLSRLSPDAIAVARAVAVLAEGAGVSPVSRLAGISPPRAAAAGRELVAAEILHPEQPLAFVHPLVREVVYLDLTPVQRELDHVRAAELLRDLGAADERVAAQLMAVEPTAVGWAGEVLRRVARTAIALGAPESAVAYLRRAVLEPCPEHERLQALFELAMAESLVDAGAAARHLEAARAGLTDPLQRGLAAHALARVLLFTEPARRARAVAVQALGELPADLGDHGDLRAALKTLVLYMSHFGAPDSPLEVELSEARTPPPPGAGVGRHMLAAVAAWEWALIGGPARECAELALAALRGGHLAQADPGFTAIIAIAVLVLADHDAALPAWEEALGRAQRLGSLDAVSGVHMWRGWTWLRQGELKEAEESLRLALEVSRLWNPAGGSAIPFAAGPLACVYLERGEPEMAAEVLLHSGSPAPGSDGDSLCRQARIQVLLAKGALAEAIREADNYASSLRRIVNPAWAPWRSLKAEALARAGRREEAERLMQEELTLARQWGAPSVVGRSLRLLGSLRRESGIGLLRDAVEKTAEGPSRLEQAKALASLGIALRHAQGPAQARGPLRRALDLAERCGSTPLAELSRTELRASGMRPRRRPLLGPESLTPSERRVVDLAAEGRANRDIAETLFVTPKTVEVHLSNAYRKLGIQSRHRLRAALELAVHRAQAQD